MKFNLFASLGMLLSLSLAQTGYGAELRPENYDSLFPADEISNADSDFAFDESDLDLNAVRPINPGHPSHPGNPGHPNPGHPGHPGNPGHPYPGHPGHPGNPGHPYPGHPGHPGYYPPGYSSVQCFAEDYYGNWYSSIGPRRQSGYVQQRALYNCRQSGNACWAKGCRAY